MRPYKIEVLVRSHTAGPDGTSQVQQDVVLEEYSDDEQIHVLKNFHIAKAVTAATMQACEELAQAAGFLTSLEDAPKQPKANAKKPAKK